VPGEFIQIPAIILIILQDIMEYTPQLLQRYVRVMEYIPQYLKNVIGIVEYYPENAIGIVEYSPQLI
jgi:hypothetical protein